MKNVSKQLIPAFIVASMPFQAMANTPDHEVRIQQLEEQIAALAEAMDETSSQQTSKTTFGGYGELKYHSNSINGTGFAHLDAEDEQKDGNKDIDATRFVLFIGHEFTNKIHLHSEFEVEHAVSGAGKRGIVEMEQMFIDFKLRPNLNLKTGMMLMPIGITNETHEPPTFYGVDRPIVEKTIIPTTWWSTGVMASYQHSSGIAADYMIHEGLAISETWRDDNPNDVYNIRKSKSKSSYAPAYDLAHTVRLSYTGTAGLNVTLYGQYQPDMDQSAEDSYAEDAMMLGGHVIYQWRDLKLTGLYAQWTLNGDDAKTAKQDHQYGHYVEASYRLSPSYGVFARNSEWSMHKDSTRQQLNYGASFWPHEDIVFKFDIQEQNNDAGNLDGFSIGMGYQF